MKDSKPSPAIKKRRKSVQAVVKFLLEDDNPAEDTAPQDSLADKTEVARRVKKILKTTKRKTTSPKKRLKQPANSR